VRKLLLAQHMVRIRILPVVRRAKGYSREVRGLLPDSSGTQDVVVGRFDNGRPAAHSRTDCASQRPNPSQIIRASVGTSPWLESFRANRHSPLRRQTSWRRSRQSGRRAHLACANGYVKISRRRAKNHGNTGLRQGGSQSGRLDGRVVWHSETIRAACPARTPHGNMLSLAHHLEPESAERGDYSGLWGIDRKLGHQAGMVASATKASRSGESSGRTSAPNVSM